MNSIRIATRKSPLAMTQTKQVAGLLKNLYPNLEIIIVPISSMGDDVLSTPLHKFSEVGVFVKQLEEALIKGEADCALHCLKDLPEPIGDSFTLAAFLKRGEVEDVLISWADTKPEDLKQVATGSLRRRAFLQPKYTNWAFTELRGNINTRIKKVLTKQVEATILAQVGITRLKAESVLYNDFVNDLAKLEVAPIPLELLPPAPGQGCLVLECLKDSEDNHQLNQLIKLLSPLNDLNTEICVRLERNIMHLVEGGCRTPLGVWARIVNHDAETSSTSPANHKKRLLKVSVKFEKTTNRVREIIKLNREIVLLESGNEETTQSAIFTLGKEIAEELLT